MMQPINSFFHPFAPSVNSTDVPEKFVQVVNSTPHPLCIRAAEEIHAHLSTQTEWQHNFGLDAKTEGPVIGKMFGVLIVKNERNEIGYLTAFSGKMAGTNHLPGFVPPVYDTLFENSFVNVGMVELTEINNTIKKLEEEKPEGYEITIEQWKEKRKNHSVALQNKIFDQYAFLNKYGEEKSLRTLFEDAGYKNPPVGAGECAGPKLLQYAFQHHLQPLAIAEFWWGQSPKSETWKHKAYYACCKEKCAPILKFMLQDIE